jgi:hypothetical protein
MPMAIDPALLARQWKQLQALAAERGRQKPIDIALGARVTITPDPADEQDRRPFQGSLEQVTRDAIEFTRAAPVTERYMALSHSQATARQLIDTADSLHASLRAAGV